MRDYDYVPYKNFYMMPEAALTAMARDFLFEFSSLNDPNMGGYRSGAISLPLNGRSCVMAEKGSLRINFGSAVIQGWMMGSLMDVESIVEEGRRNIAQDPEIPPSIVRVYDDLERETSRFLDHLTGGAALNARDVLNLGRENGVALHLTKG